MNFSYAKLITEWASFAAMCNVSLCPVAEKNEYNVSHSSE